MISIGSLTVSFGALRVLDNAAWHIGANDRIGLVGPNGAGKSTLLRVLAGALEPDSGTISRPNDAVIGYQSQETKHMHGKTVWDVVLTGRQDVLDIERELRRIEHLISEPGIVERELDRRLKRYADLQEAFEKIDGYQVESDAARVLGGLGFPRERWENNVEAFSGGWQVRVSLARVLLQQPDYLLLDEPTNYLDLENIIWLEDVIKNYRGAVVMVSHDRAFLDACVTRITEVAEGVLIDYPGNYAKFLAERDARREQLIATAKNQENKIEEMRRTISRFRVTARRASQAQSQLKRLTKLEEEKVVLPSVSAKVAIRFPECARSGKDVILAEGAGHGYGDLTVFTGVDFRVVRGERAALVGVNGAGKSTLMRLCAGRETPREGRVTIGANVEPLYFAQDAALVLREDKTVLQEIEDGCDDAWRPRIRDLLGAFLFRGDDVHKPTEVLSGGEKTRLCLACLLARHGNLLLLDEPTNHLDIETKRILVDSLNSYTGTMLFVSHDRFFLENVATKIIEIDNGVVTEYPWSYREYLEWKAELSQEAG